MKQIMGLEWFYLIRSRWFYLVLLLFVAWKGVALGVSQSSGGEYAVILLLIIITVLLCHKDIKEDTLKNYVSSGISLTTIFWGRWLLMTILACIFQLIDDMAVTIYFYVMKLSLPWTILQIGMRMAITVGIIWIIYFLCCLIDSDIFSAIVSLVYLFGLPILLFFIQLRYSLGGWDKIEFNTLRTYVSAGWKWGLLKYLGIGLLITLLLDVIVSFLYRFRRIK